MERDLWFAFGRKKDGKGTSKGKETKEIKITVNKVQCHGSQEKRVSKEGK